MNKLSALICSSTLVAGLCFGSAATSFAQKRVTINVDTKNEIATIAPNMYGIFFEDINFGADGGLYAELIKNRSFDFTQPFVGWVPFGDAKIESSDPCFDRNPNYLRLTREQGSLTGSGVDNEGFKGIGIKATEQYRLTFYTKVSGVQPLTIRIELINSQNNNLYKHEISVQGEQWTKQTLLIDAPFTDAHSRLRIKLVSQGTICMDHISLFPVKTWKGRENGMRADLAQALYDLKPGVFRFPGGCIVEGTTLETRYQWKNTLGVPENRPYNINRWNYTFEHKSFPDYFQSYGLGFYEYFLLCEDFGADALPVLSCGIACQFENDQCVALDQLQPYIDDALDLIEFANGSATSKWGKVRAQMGHHEPFNLKMIGVGNEQWGKVYPERLEMFVEAIRAKYPNILIIGSSGPSADGEQFDYLWGEMKRIGVDLVDEHYYKDPNWFFANAGRYDNYDRKAPKVFAGEYASHHAQSDKENNFMSAISEAAFMTGLERNADVVRLATYAPLFAHVDAWQWRPDLIWFSNTDRLLTPNYYVQQLYGHNSGTNALKTTSAQSDLKGGDNLYCSSVIDKNKSEIIVKIVNAGDESKECVIDLGKTKFKLDEGGNITVLQSNNLLAVNTFLAPNTIVPKTSEITQKGNQIEFMADKYSFSVITIKYNK